MLENKKITNNFCEDTYMSRFIASWANVGGDFGISFEEWLKSFGFDDRTIRDTVEMAICGKLELEMNARQWLKIHPEESYYSDLEA